jgi:hypothetical protein
VASGPEKISPNRPKQKSAFSVSSAGVLRPGKVFSSAATAAAPFHFRTARLVADELRSSMTSVRTFQW